MRRSLKTKLDAVARAEDAAVELLKHQYPEGTEVYCWLMHGQIIPSKGVVIGHPGGRYGHINVRLESRRRRVRTVPVSAIVEDGV